MRHTSRFRKFICGVLDWHSPAKDSIYFDGFQLHGNCRYCGAACLKDSQGNWFRFAILFLVVVSLVGCTVTG